jgi:DNA-binding response OmpR family regulator
VLVVDDNDGVRRVVCEMLRMEGFAVDSVASAQQALQAVRHAEPHAIVLDMMMPDMNGLDAIRALRAGGAKSKIVAVSGLPDLLGMAASIGADDVLMKPLNPDELVAAIRRALAPRASA